MDILGHTRKGDNATDSQRPPHQRPGEARRVTAFVLPLVALREAMEDAAAGGRSTFGTTLEPLGQPVFFSRLTPPESVP